MSGLTNKQKKEIEAAVKKAVEQYYETFKKLGDNDGK